MIDERDAGEMHPPIWFEVKLLTPEVFFIDAEDAEGSVPKNNSLLRYKYFMLNK